MNKSYLLNKTATIFGTILIKYGKALEFFQNCLDIQLKSLPSNHPSIAASYGNIGSVYDSKGEYDQALEFHQKCFLK